MLESRQFCALFLDATDIIEQFGYALQSRQRLSDGLDYLAVAVGGVHTIRRHHPGHLCFERRIVFAVVTTNEQALALVHRANVWRRNVFHHVAVGFRHGLQEPPEQPRSV